MDKTGYLYLSMIETCCRCIRMNVLWFWKALTTPTCVETVVLMVIFDAQLQAQIHDVFELFKVAKVDTLDEMMSQVAQTHNVY